MNLREIIVSIGCCAAAVCLGFGKPARAGEPQSGTETDYARDRAMCREPSTRTEETAGCERIDGHVRVQFGSRIPNASGYGQPGASPVAVRLEDGTPSRGHLRLPAREPQFDQYRR